MIIFKDVISKDEMISDSFDMVVKENGIVYEVDCAMIVEGAVQVNTGANASAEEAAEELEDGAVQVNNVVNSFRLQSSTFDKKSYLSHLKSYMKKIKDHLAATGASEEEVNEFQSGAQAFAKKIVANFKDYEFFTGESMDIDGMVALMNYREDGTTPYLIFWKHGLKQEKV